MKRLSLVFVLLISTAYMALAQQPAHTPPMKLSTPGFADGTVIPLKYTQASPTPGVSPELVWSNVPAGTQSFVLWMHDVDVAVAKGTEDNLHWFVWNIPGQSTSLTENVPSGTQLPDGTYQTSFNGPGYRGPGASAAGPLHHYIFELFALDIKLDEKAAATPTETRMNIFKLMQGHILSKAACFGLFHRPQ